MWFERLVFSILYVNKSDMNLIKYTEEFPDEASCKAHFRTQREQWRLSRKNSRAFHHWFEGNQMWQCRMQNAYNTGEAVRSCSPPNYLSECGN